MDPFSIAAAITAALKAAAAAGPAAAATTAATTAGASGAAAAAGATAGAAAAGGGLTAAGLGAGATLGATTVPSASLFAPGFAGLNAGLGTAGGAGLSATGAVPGALAIGGSGSGLGALAGLGTTGTSLAMNPGVSSPVVPGTGLKSNVGQVGTPAKQSLMKQITEGAEAYSPFIETGLGMIGGRPDSPSMGGVPFQGFQPMQRPKGTPIQLGGNAAQFSVAPYQPGNRNIITPQFGR